MMDRAQGGRRGVQLDSDNFVVRMLANLPTMMKSDVTIAVFRRAKRVLQSFDLILVGEWERDPRQRRALVDLLLRNAVSSWGGSGHARAKSGTSAYGTRTGEEYAEQQLSRYMDDDTVAALLGLSDVAAEAAVGAMAAGPSWFVDGELSEEDNKGRTGWIASHRCVKAVCRSLTRLRAVHPSTPVERPPTNTHQPTCTTHTNSTHQLHTTRTHTHPAHTPHAHTSTPHTHPIHPTVRQTATSTCDCSARLSTSALRPRSQRIKINGPRLRAYRAGRWGP